MQKRAIFYIFLFLIIYRREKRERAKEERYPEVLPHIREILRTVEGYQYFLKTLTLHTYFILYFKQLTSCFFITFQHKTL